MKINISKTTLENILIHVQPFLEKKDTSAITSHVYFEAIDNNLIVKATDFEISLEVSVTNINIEENGRVTANGKKLLDIIRILKDDNIVLSTKQNNLHIKQNKSNFKLPMFDSNEFPTLPNIEAKDKISINSADLIESLKKITSAADSNNPKFELNGALIDMSNNVINFVSTDTRRLALVTLENDSSNDLKLILPKKAIVEIQKLFFNNVEIFYDKTYFIIKSQTYTFSTKLINGNFPDYTRIIPKEISKNLTLPKAIIIEAIKQINTISSDIKLTFDMQSITFESLSDDNIEAKTQIEFNTNLEQPFSVAVNSRYILDFLAQTTSSDFNMGLNEANLPFVLIDGNFKTIVMPIVI
ncbi:MAG: DNA polymerase III subunit beta [Helicobacteraceae bacterium]|nr:DNA polymerase III subunit beta [Helicobacteraceae bacterium]